MMRLRLGSTVWLSALSLILLLPESTAARGDGFLERRDQQLPACAVSLDALPLLRVPLVPQPCREANHVGLKRSNFDDVAYRHHVY